MHYIRCNAFIPQRKPYKIINMNKFYKFLDGIRKAVNISEIERLGGLPDKCIAKHYVWRNTGKGWPLPEKHIVPLFVGLCKAFPVIEYYGVIIRWDPQKNFLLEIPTGEPDISEDKPDHFVYSRTLYKDAYDHYDFLYWVLNEEKH